MKLVLRKIVKPFHRLVICLALVSPAFSACSSSSSSAIPSQNAFARVRFAEGSPLLEADVNGQPQALGSNVYLQLDKSTVASSFSYGTLTSFLNVTAGAHTVTARNPLGYAVGPLKVPSLTANVRYSLVLVGAYPNYSVLAFEEPAPNGAQLSLYEASPSLAQAGFGKFRASTGSSFVGLGTARYGAVSTVGLGKSVADFGGYAGNASAPLGKATPAQIDSFDTHNELPFHNITRLSLFLFDGPSSSKAQVFGSLDP